MYLLESHIVHSLQNATRFESYCQGLFTQLPSNKGVKKAIKKGSIRLNGEIVESSRYLNENDSIELWDLEENSPEPFPLDIEILYEDEHLAIVFKPSGLVTSGNLFRTLENCIQNQVNVSSLKEGLKWPKPVHRLDSPTSGLVIVSKSVPAHIKLGEMLKNKSIQKKYHAVVQGEWPDFFDYISDPIDGKESISEIELIRSTKSLRNGYLSLIQLSPVTGRTHQLRIHTSRAGYPIVGDTQYGIKGNTLEHKGLFLCATQLEFNHPISENPLNIKVDIPTKFITLMDRELERFHKFENKDE